MLCITNLQDVVVLAKFNVLAKSLICNLTVIPAKAGIQ